MDDGKGHIVVWFTCGEYDADIVLLIVEYAWWARTAPDLAPGDRYGLWRRADAFCNGAEKRREIVCGCHSALGF